MSLVKGVAGLAMAGGSAMIDNMTNETKTPYKVQYPAKNWASMDEWFLYINIKKNENLLH